MSAASKVIRPAGPFPMAPQTFFALRAAARNVNRSPLLCVNEKKFVNLG